jgi:hypothetical protein
MQNNSAKKAVEEAKAKAAAQSKAAQAAAQAKAAQAAAQAKANQAKASAAAIANINSTLSGNPFGLGKNPTAPAPALPDQGKQKEISEIEKQINALDIRISEFDKQLTTAKDNKTKATNKLNELKGNTNTTRQGFSSYFEEGYGDSDDELENFEDEDDDIGNVYLSGNTYSSGY